MDLDAVIHRWDAPLTRHLQRLVGSPELAEDLRQELYLRAWRAAPAGLDERGLGAWLHRVGSNLAFDALRRRRLRTWEELPDAVAAADVDSGARLAVEAALAELAPHDRLLLALEQAGYSQREIGELLDVAPDAARKRLARARERFARVYRATTRGRRPVVALTYFDTDPDPYRRWLEAAGVDVVLVSDGAGAARLAVADGLVMAGSDRDLHPALYGERPRRALGSPDLAVDRAEMRLLRQALDRDMPVLGICRGHQLLNVAHGGTLYQDVSEQAAAPVHHLAHPVATARGTRGRTMLGREPRVPSGHHQSVRRLGRGIAVLGSSPDGVVEMIEQPRRGFAVGVQWHPEARPDSEPSRRLRDSFVDELERAA